MSRSPCAPSDPFLTDSLPKRPQPGNGAPFSRQEAYFFSCNKMIIYKQWLSLLGLLEQLSNAQLLAELFRHPMFLVFVGLVAFFHVSEFTLAAVYDRDNLGYHSWLISPPYCLALLAACAEYWVESSLFPGMKGPDVVSLVGLVVALLGEAIRKTGIITAGSSFTHHIRHHREQNHRLITEGIYRYIRHPGYLGWFLWAVGLQAMLCNPVCFISFAIISWRFFATRIPYEEHFLVTFFGDRYDSYRKRTPTYIPFIK
ncbi:protein-S-isoprenylcysteine O-methyltransferase [Klebsormidium nitens]|uniref:Protein-S-isoprenylcysteine O-methyltransferase n=1 Tax=Klebsormidium nitens TaxID=105231 RepID=A0A1Y1I0L9_KLENI|nr:protein-S-isoprenylcysteine O-methyltransferase [Klebsormidium nitens]|eukprot:GAQ82316.1 protein-S-isoprenylcysteine O-methyltransferase [Klebsormidium nitens]